MRLKDDFINRLVSDYPNELDLEYILKNVKVDGNCWFVSENHSQYTLHRYIFRIFNPTKPIEGLMVCHRCDRPGCINPNHLFVGTATDNNRDSRLKGNQFNQVREKFDRTLYNKRVRFFVG